MPGKLVLRCGAKEIGLQAKEEQILEFLILNAGIIASQEAIIEKVWGFDGNAEYNNVEKHISLIRRKLAGLEASVSIKTIRGAGYILSETANGNA
jgi:DNA-binding response OmpR family regulator